MSGAATAEGPDFSVGIAIADVPPGGTLVGRVGEHPVLLSRLGGELFAVSGTCTHSGAALGEGLIHDGTVRCPLHHACFDLRTGRALPAPALDEVELLEPVRDAGDAVRLQKHDLRQFADRQLRRLRRADRQQDLGLVWSQPGVACRLLGEMREAPQLGPHIATP